MKKIIALILALLFCLPACAEITSEGSKIPSLLDDEVTAFAFHQKLDGFAEAEDTTDNESNVMMSILFIISI